MASPSSSDRRTAGGALAVAVTVTVTVAVGVAVALAGGLAVAGCRRAPSPKDADSAAAAVTVRDGLGRAVRVPRPLERIVSLAPSSTEILFAVGAGARVVGVDRYSDFPAAARALPRVGADVDPSLERILALRPALVFTATSANGQKTVEAMERLGIAVYVSHADTLADIYRDITGIGAAAGAEEGARAVVRRMEGEVAAIRARVAGTRPVRALVVVGTDPLIVAGARSHIGDLIAAAGGKNVADDSQQAFPSYSVERLIARAPEVLIIGTYPTDPAPSLGSLSRLDTLPAVRDHRVHTVDGDLIFRPGPRVALGIAALARLLHP